MKGEEKNNSGEQKIALNSFFSYASDLRTGEKKVFQDVFFYSSVKVHHYSMILFRKWDSGALQPFVAEMSITTIIT